MNTIFGAPIRATSRGGGDGDGGGEFVKGNWPPDTFPECDGWRERMKARDHKGDAGVVSVSRG